MQIKTDELIPKFPEQVQELANAYRTAIESGNYKMADEIIDVYLRALIQEEYDYIDAYHEEIKARLGQPHDAIFMSLHGDRLTRKLQSLQHKKNFLDTLLFDEQKWQEFSQKLKSRGELTLPQLQHAD